MERVEIELIELQNMLANFDVSANNTDLIKRFGNKPQPKPKYFPQSCRSERQPYYERNPITAELMYDTPLWEKY